MMPSLMIDHLSINLRSGTDIIEGFRAILEVTLVPFSVLNLR